MKPICTNARRIVSVLLLAVAGMSLGCGTIAEQRA